jgi:hypothetical protein
MFLWSIKEHKIFKENYSFRDTSTFPKRKVSIIKEPGIKIRPVTAGETWVNVYLSPAGHMLKSFVETLPACRVGLGDAANLYKFSLEFGQNVTDEDFISTSDMTSATDRATHDVGFGILKSLVDELHAQRMITTLEMKYLTSAASLLNTPKLLSVRMKGRQFKMLQKAIYGNKVHVMSIEKTKNGKLVNFVNSRGIMMGDPLTKIVLTLSSYTAWKMSKITRSVNVRGFRLPKPENRNEEHSSVKSYACAGDDHIGIGKRMDLGRIPRIMESMNFEISWSKYDINKSEVSYCQDFGILGKENLVSMLRSRAPGREKEANFIQIDVPKIRLLNQFQKMGGKENFDSPDPLIGKAKMLEGQNAYFRDMLSLREYIREDDPMSLTRYLDRLQTYMDFQTTYLRLLMPSWMEPKVIKMIELYVPTYLGGIGVQLPSRIKVEESAAAQDFVRRYLTYYKKPEVVDKVIEWERGINQEMIIINNLVSAGMLQEPLSSDEVFDKTKREIAESIASGSQYIGGRKVWNKINEDYVNASEPIPLVSSKENAYTFLTINPETPFTVVKKTRTRQKITGMRRKLHKVAPFAGPVTFVRPTRVDLWVERSSLTAALKTQFVKPNLKIPRSLFSHNQGNRYNGPMFIPNTDEVRMNAEPGSIEASLGESPRTAHSSSEMT